jgi:tetratricopeptide (TPR) repeat protein
MDAVAANLARAARLHEAGSHLEARVACLELLRRAPDRADVLSLLGRIEADLGRLNVAERLLRKSLDRDAVCAASVRALGRVLALRGEDAEALALYSRAIELDPSPAEQWLDRARVYRRLGRIVEAETDLRSALAREPNRPQALDELGLVLVEQHNDADAVSCFERAIRAQPAYAIAHDHLGRVHLALGRVAQALRCFENALHHDPGLATAHDHLGLALHEEGRFLDALSHHDRACTLAPERADFAAHRAAALAAAGRDAEAEAAYRDVLARAPDFSAALVGLAELMDSRGEFQGGLELVEGAAASASAGADLRLVCARLLGRVFRVPEALALLQPLAAADTRSRITVAQQRRLELTLGDLHDRAGDHEHAFQCYERGSRLKAARFDARKLDADVRELMEAFSAASLPRLARAATAAPELLFVVGMPGAGGGLVEQILASHPHVCRAHAASALEAVANELGARGGPPYPKCVRLLDESQLERAAAAFRSALPARPTEVRYVVVRAPSDFLHLGLAELLFPRARVVHCVRDEMDTALSCYAQDSTDRALAFSGSFAGIAAYLRAHRRLMAHWRAVLHTPIYELSYETLVTEPAREVRALTAFLGLPWKDSCLYPGGSARGRSTQGRPARAIYASSAGRHRAYAQQLAPLRALLDAP